MKDINMTINRLRSYQPSGNFRKATIANRLQTSQDTNVIISTLIQNDLIQNDFSDKANDIESSWSNYIFNYIVESLKEVKEIEKVIVDVFQKDIIRIWSVIKEENKTISSQIYKKEMEILEYLANFTYDIDFHLITKDMLNDAMNKDSKVMFDREQIK